MVCAMKEYPKIIFMDLEGTLLKKEYKLDNGKVAPSAWTVLAKYLGEECYIEEEKTKEKWLKGEYSGYVEWMRDTINIHKKYNLKYDVFKRVIDSVEIKKGVRKSIDEFRSNGAITAIITGGFKALADRVQRELKIDHALCGCEYFFDDRTGYIEHFNLLPSDEKGKVDFMKLLLNEYKFGKKDCVFIGDGKNDVHLAKSVGLAIALDAQKELKEVSNIIIDQGPNKEDFYDVAIAIKNNFIV